MNKLKQVFNIIAGYTPVLKYVTLTGFLLLQGCSDGFLDIKPDRELVVPNSLDDLRALLRNDGDMNSYYPSVGIIASDNLYIGTTVWEGLRFPATKKAYIWESNVFDNPEGDGNDWSYPYTTVFYANVVLQSLEDITPGAGQRSEWDKVKGEALFFRAYAFYHLAQVFAQPYQESTASEDLGIALRLDPNPNLKSVRSTVRETYDRIITDANRAIHLLPVTPEFKNNPSKPAAYGLLARAYLSMGDYSRAGLYADSCLQLQGTLMDFNTLDTSALNPVPPSNSEIVFHSTMVVNSYIFSRGHYRVDSILYKSYGPDDLRREIYFEAAGDSGFVFTGNYNDGSILFNGIASDEMYLIKAECEARAGNVENAIHYLNTLMEKRYRKESFVPYEAGSAGETLVKVLSERRKELAFRSLRWTDLRRLNLEPRFAKTVKRVINGRLYELPPNDPRYTFPIPQKVIELSGMPQNPR